MYFEFLYPTCGGGGGGGGVRLFTIQNRCRGVKLRWFNFFVADPYLDPGIRTTILNIVSISDSDSIEFNFDLSLEKVKSNWFFDTQKGLKLEY